MTIFNLNPKTNFFILLLALPLLAGCQMGYIIKSGLGQFQLMNQREPIKEVLKKNSLDDSTREKLNLALEAKAFAENELGLISSKNYSTFVQLDQPYVTYVISAAPKWKLEHHQWSYPFMGKMPYKGYFNEQDALAEEQNLQKNDQELDTYLRGVSAYSTLGWFNDPLLSSMLRYSNYDLVNTIIHETVHATLYIKHAADFNERLATFLGNKGAELFYLKKEGADADADADASTLKSVQEKSQDDKLFSVFISKELQDLKNWYAQLSKDQRDENLRNQRIIEIQTRFDKEVIPQLKTEAYKNFSRIKLNNARLLVYKTYMDDLSDFEKLFEIEGRSFGRFLAACKNLEKSKDPEAELKKLIATYTAARQ